MFLLPANVFRQYLKWPDRTKSTNTCTCCRIKQNFIGLNNFPFDKENYRKSKEIKKKKLFYKFNKKERNLREPRQIKAKRYIEK